MAPLKVEKEVKGIEEVGDDKMRTAWSESEPPG